MNGAPPPQAPSSLALGLAFSAVYFVWGSTYLAIRVAVEHLPPFLMAGARFLCAGSLLYAWCALRGEPAPKRVHWRSAAIVGLLLLTCSNGAVVWAETRVPSGLTALFVATLPLWMVLLEWRWEGRARPDGTTVLGLLLGSAGVAVLVLPNLASAAPIVNPAGAVALCLAPMTWALGSMYARRAPLPASTLQATAMQMLCAGAALLVLSATLEPWSAVEPSSTPAAAWLALGYLVVFGSLVALSAYGWLLKVSTPARISTYAYVNPLVALALGAAFKDEQLSAPVLLAAALILGAVALILRARQRRPGAARRS